VELISLHALLFLAGCLAAVALPLPAAARRALLLAFNLAFLWSFHPLAPALFLGVSALGLLGCRLAARGAPAALLVLLGLPLLVPLFLPKLPGLTGEGSGIGNVVGARLAVFIGASYFTLRTLHSILEARRQRRVPLGVLDYLAWNSFFPTIVAGPIERADHFAQSLDRLGRPSAEDLRTGVARLFIGLVKKLVLGTLALQWAGPITGFGDAQAPALATSEAWVALYAIALYAWFDFAGYSDMAIGAARLMGLRLAENFDNPYLRTSISEFWRGWHLSLSFWIRDYLFLPLCGRSSSRVRPHLAALASMTLCGLWHAPNVGWALWGLCHGAGLSVHQAWTGWLRRRFALKKRLAQSRVVRVASIALTFHFVALTWTLVSIDPARLEPTLAYLAILFGQAPP
jgi:alginate O-acetyltransferase complex protein AlgI